MAVEVFEVTVLKLDKSAVDAEDAIFLSAPAERFPGYSPGQMLRAQVLNTGGGFDVLEVGAFGVQETGYATIEGVEELAGKVQIVVAATEVAAYTFTPGATLSGAYFGPTLSLIELPGAVPGGEEVEGEDEGEETEDGEFPAIGADNPA